MFELSHEELLRCQIGTSSWGGSRYGAFAFTEIGVAMLSGVLKSKVAVEANRKINYLVLCRNEIIVFYILFICNIHISNFIPPSFFCSRSNCSRKWISTGVNSFFVLSLNLSYSASALALASCAVIFPA